MLQSGQLDRPLYDAADALSHLRTNDPELGRLIEAAGPLQIKIRPNRSVFEVLLRSIVYQQLSDRAASTIYARLGAALGGPSPTPSRLLDLDEEVLRGAGLSRGKIRAARDLAQRTLAGELPDRNQMQAMSDEEVVERLTRVHGVGPWTAQMLLIFHLGRPDVLPITDLGVRKGFMLTYGMDAMPSGDDLLARAQRWKPYRSIASWYLWRAVDLNSGTAPPEL